MPHSNQFSLRLFRGSKTRSTGVTPLQPIKREPNSRKVLAASRQSPSRRFFLDQKTSGKSPARQKALLVDNGDVAIQEIKWQLMKLGFDVSFARSGHECLQRLRRSAIDVLILSADVISESEEEVLTRLRKVRLKPSAIVVILGGDEDSLNQLNIPHDLHLRTPADVGELADWVSGEWFSSCF